MLRLLSFLSFLGTSLAQFRPPVLTLAPSPTVPVFTIGSIAPIRTIRTTIENITSTLSTTTILPTQTNSVENTDEPENIGEINENLFFIIIPLSLLLLFLTYFYLRKKKRAINVNIDLNIENKIPSQEPTRKLSNLSNHFYEEVNYEAMYEMPDTQNVKYENVIEENNIQENEYGKQVTTIV